MCIPHIGSLIIQKCYKINQYSILHDFVESKHRITNHIWIALALASSGLSEFRNFCKLNIRLFTFATHKKMPQHRPWCPQCRIELQKCSAPPNLETRSSPFVTNANNRLKVFFCVFSIHSLAAAHFGSGKSPTPAWLSDACQAVSSLQPQSSGCRPIYIEIRLKWSMRATRWKTHHRE